MVDYSYIVIKIFYIPIFINFTITFHHLSAVETE